MKLTYAAACVALVFVGCQPPVDNSADEAFEKTQKPLLR